MSKITPFHPHWLQTALNKRCPGCCYMLIWDTQVCRHGCHRAGYSHKCPRVLGVTSCLPRTWPSCSQGWGAPAPLVPHKTEAFPMSLWGASRTKVLLPACPWAIPFINPLQTVWPLWLGFPTEAVPVCNTWIGFSRGTLGISMVTW